MGLRIVIRAAVVPALVRAVPTMGPSDALAQDLAAHTATTKTLNSAPDPGRGRRPLSGTAAGRRQHLPQPFYTTPNDLDSIVQFIRQRLTGNSRPGSPDAIAGESYARMRVAALMRLLAKKYSINLNHTVMISTELNVDFNFKGYSLVWPMVQIPTRATIAASYDRGGFGPTPPRCRRSRTMR